MQPEEEYTYKTYDTAAIYLEEGWYKIGELKKWIEESEALEALNKQLMEKTNENTKEVQSRR
jgi:hypothetical protein